MQRRSSAKGAFKSINRSKLWREKANKVLQFSVPPVNSEWMLRMDCTLGARGHSHVAVDTRYRRLWKGSNDYFFAKRRCMRIHQLVFTSRMDEYTQSGSWSLKCTETLERLQLIPRLLFWWTNRLLIWWSLWTSICLISHWADIHHFYGNCNREGEIADQRSLPVAAAPITAESRSIVNGRCTRIDLNSNGANIAD